MYKLLPDGTILLSEEWEELWDIFAPPLKYFVGPDVAECKFPTNLLTSFTGVLDSDSGFTSFTNSNNNGVDSSITTEGIALSPYYGGFYSSPSINFRLNISTVADEVRIYYLPVDYGKLKCITRKFCVDKLCVTLLPLGFYYFWINAGKNYSCTLEALSTNNKNNNNDNDSNNNGNDSKNKIVVNNKIVAVKNNGNIIPTKCFYKLANLIQISHYILEKPVPLTPIITPRTDDETIIIYSLNTQGFLFAPYVESGETTHYTGRYYNDDSPAILYKGNLIDTTEVIANNYWNYGIVDVTIDNAITNNNVTQRDIKVTWTIEIEAGDACSLDILKAYNSGGWKYPHLDTYTGKYITTSKTTLSGSFPFKNAVNIGLGMQIYNIVGENVPVYVNREIRYKLELEYQNRRA